jgi:hypothetical protein
VGEVPNWPNGSSPQPAFLKGLPSQAGIHFLLIGVLMKFYLPISGCRVKRSIGVWIVLLLMMCLLPLMAHAEEGDLKKGKTLYLKHCKICHGLEGKGDGYTHFNPPVADLTASQIQKKIR